MQQMTDTTGHTCLTMTPRVSSFLAGLAGLAGLFLIAAAGCGDDAAPAKDAAPADGPTGGFDAAPADAGDPADASSSTGCTTPPCAALVLDVPAAQQRSVDLLFVIDNSQSMQAAQESLLANFPRFIEVLSRGEEGLPSLHVGVISSRRAAARPVSAMRTSPVRSRVLPRP